MSLKNAEIFTPVNIVGFCLITMAGWIDVIGVKLFFNQRCAFMTGRASAIGQCFAEHSVEAFFVIMIVVAFMIGAAIGTVLTKKKGLIAGLLFTGIVVVIAAFGVGPAVEAAMVKKLVGFEAAKRIILAVLIPMAMGCMNATTTLTSLSRTTHLTGPATDVGMNFALRNWKLFVFWIWRWIGFPLGAFIGVVLAIKGMDASLNLALPGIGIIIVAVAQRLSVNIPLK